MLNERVETAQCIARPVTPEIGDLLEKLPLETLAQHFLAAWQQAHGVRCGSASVLVGIDRLALLVEDGFAPAEINLARQFGAGSGEMLRQYIERLVEQITPDIASRVELAIGRRVALQNISCNVEQGWVMLFFGLV